MIAEQKDRRKKHTVSKRIVRSMCHHAGPVISHGRRRRRPITKFIREQRKPVNSRDPASKGKRQKKKHCRRIKEYPAVRLSVQLELHKRITAAVCHIKRDRLHIPIQIRKHRDHTACTYHNDRITCRRILK